MLLTEPEKFKDVTIAIKKDVANMPFDLKKLEDENNIFSLNRKSH